MFLKLFRIIIFLFSDIQFQVQQVRSHYLGIPAKVSIFVDQFNHELKGLLIPVLRVGVEPLAVLVLAAEAAHFHGRGAHMFNPSGLLFREDNCGSLLQHLNGTNVDSIVGSGLALRRGGTLGSFGTLQLPLKLLDLLGQIGFV